MKRKIALIFGSLLMVMQVMAQTETENKLIINDKQLMDYKELKMNPTQRIGTEQQALPINHPAIRPSLDTGMMSRIKYNPILFNYNKDGTYPIHKNLFILLAAKREAYLNLASYNLTHAALGWQINKKTALTGGLLAIKQFTNNSPFATDRSGVKFCFNYSINGHAELNIWGQYLSDSYQSSYTDFSLPQTGTGGSATLNLGGGSRVGIETEYQYDKLNKQWYYQSEGKVSLNF